MAHVIASLKPPVAQPSAPSMGARAASRQNRVALMQTDPSSKTSTTGNTTATDFKAALTGAAAAQPETKAPATTPAATAAAASSPATAASTTAKPAAAIPTTTPTAQGPDWRALFTGTVTPVVAEAAASATPPAPTAESVFGASPWMSNPTGIGPDGKAYSYNKFYFATEQTATKVAEMAGGSVVKSNMFTPTGGAFSQQQPNYMVQMPDGRLINPGLVASFYSHGYSQSYVDQMVAAELRST